MSKRRAWASYAHPKRGRQRKEELPCPEEEGLVDVEDDELGEVGDELGGVETCGLPPPGGVAAGLATAVPV
jgi:hypothetical protein